MKKIIPVLLLFPILTLLSLTDVFNNNSKSIAGQQPVREVLTALGDPLPDHYISDLPVKASVEIGEKIVFVGTTEAVSLQSPHFVCTSCHNTEKEFADLRDTAPEKRLAYAVKNDLPFLPASPLYGVVNRTTWYNGDYEKKYGELVVPARNDLREAIQLCAVECSQGRRLKNWELESVLGYLWTLELKMEDLALPASDYPKFENPNKENAAALIADLKSYYPQGSPAHFVTPPEDRREGYGLTGNAENGAELFNQSCLHCHENQRYSFFELDNSTMTKKFLKKHFPKYSRYSIYQVSRYGAPSHPGKRAYMPQFTSEKMSDQQVEDLRAYLEK